MNAGAIPSVFPNLPAYLTPNVPKPRTSTLSAEKRKEREEQFHAAQVQKSMEEDKIQSFEHLTKNVNKVELPQDVIAVKRQSTIQFISLPEGDDTSPMKMKYYLEVNTDLEFKMTMNSVYLATKKVRHLNKSDQVESFSSVSNILAFLQSKLNKDSDKDVLESVAKILKTQADIEDDSGLQKKLLFLAEQLSLALSSKMHRRYSSDLLAASLMWRSTSTALYRQFLREDCLTLPTVRHLDNLSKALTTTTGLPKTTLNYLEARYGKLNEREKYVVLMLDEIYCAERAEYAGGKFFGNIENGMCRTVLCFMIKSIGGKYSDIVAMYPVKNLDSTKILQEFNCVVEALTGIGFKVAAISVDNASPNRKFYVEGLCSGNLKTSVPHPFASEKSIFLLFDSVHNFKNVYNNFQTRKQFEFPAMTDSQTEQTASFFHLEDLYSIEMGKPVKMAYKLSDKVLHPTNIEKTNVQLADSLFHESTIAALRFYANEKNIPGFNDTADFLQVVRNWWNILNVKNPLLGTKKRSEKMKPVTEMDQKSLDYLSVFGRWLEHWKSNSRAKNVKTCLTEETFLATIQTTKATVEIAKYLLGKEEFQFVLLGSLQSDPIERRFGWYRQLSGANYFVSVKQILEAEKSIRLQSLLKHSGMTLTEAKEVFDDADVEKEKQIQEESMKLSSLVEHDCVNFKNVENDDANIVYYVAGCYARSLCKQERCTDCVKILRKSEEVPTIAFQGESSGMLQKEKEVFLEKVNRGGLCFPSDSVYMACLHSWNFYHDIKSDKDAMNFLALSSEPVKVFCHIIHVYVQQS